MLYTDISKFKKKIKLELSEQREPERNNLCFKTGEVFKQVTLFEEVEDKQPNKRRKIKKYGAWFVSDKNAIFLSKEEISEFLEKGQVLPQNNTN